MIILEILNTYLELPYVGPDNYENDTISGFGYMVVSSEDLNKYIIARHFDDNCNDNCSCDRDYYNPAFLQPDDSFSELNNYNSNYNYNNLEVLSENFILINTIHDCREIVKKLVAEGKNKNKDIIIYQLVRDKPFSRYITFKVVEIINMQF